MNLSSENELIVNDIKDLRDNDIGIVDDSDVDRLTRTFTLNILIGNSSNTPPLQLNFPGTRSVADVKKDIYSVTNIAVRHQQCKFHRFLYDFFPHTKKKNFAIL